ncbi:spore coat protein [Acetivibrio cellulolyticus]|uniref:spore coat protein n=1 Tax=Acetivibrio cellulolyticus TaxID=35830 RepID=UPI0001E2D0EE|nr:spore coat protein [Acetivibrio cellulolyticus]
MQEKEMVNDLLSQINSSVTGYANVITQTQNPQLRQAIQQIRNNCETFQYDLFKLAEQKGFYQPAQPANPNDITQVKNQFSGTM